LRRTLVLSIDFEPAWSIDTFFAFFDNRLIKYPLVFIYSLMHFINRTSRVCTIIIFGFLSIIFFCISCNDIKRNNSHPEILNSDIRKGQELAKKYCQSCHPLPGPESLDGKTWGKGVLSAMGPEFDWRQGPPFLVLKNTGKKG
jgi:hypothetical protein